MGVVTQYVFECDRCGFTETSVSTDCFPGCAPRMHYPPEDWLWLHYNGHEPLRLYCPWCVKNGAVTWT